MERERSNTATLIRTSHDSRQTLGVLIASAGDKLFTCKTLELAWKDNQPNISCVPAGRYKCYYTRSSVLSAKKGADVFTYEVIGVPGRTGIRIHSANYFHQLRGCIALGAAHKDLNADTIMDLVHSGETVKAFESFMNKEAFALEIINWDKRIQLGRLSLYFA
jgi:hypothetical protein